MAKDISAPLARLLEGKPEYIPEVKHHFSTGVCIREMQVCQGALIVGAMHITNHITMLIKGTMQITINGESKLYEAPHTFEALAGSRKVGLAYTDCVVSNVFPTYSTDINAIERMFTDMHVVKDRESFSLVLASYNLTLEYANKASFNAATYTATNSIHNIQDSAIHGKGLFSSCAYKVNEYIGVASESNMRYELGRYVNHSVNPNIRFVFTEGLCAVYAIKDIHINEEFTVCYNKNLKELQCQQQ